MKRIALLILSVVLTITVFAQSTPGAKEKNAGNDAWKAKNYAEAFKNFEAYLKALTIRTMLIFIIRQRLLLKLRSMQRLRNITIWRSRTSIKQPVLIMEKRSL